MALLKELLVAFDAALDWPEDQDLFEDPVTIPSALIETRGAPVAACPQS